MGNHWYAIKDFSSAINIQLSKIVVIVDKEITDKGHKEKQELKHDLEMAYIHRGNSKLKSQYVKEAIVDYKEAEKLSADGKAVIDDGLGQCHHALYNYPEALFHYSDAIDKSKEKPNVEFLKNRA